MNRHTASRRTFLTMLAAAATGLAAACAPAAPPAPATAPAAAKPTSAPPAPTAAPASATPAAQAAAPKVAPTVASAGGATAQPAATSRGALTVAIGINFTATLDATKDGSRHTYLGLGETLTRATPDLTIEPWLAERVTNVDPVTWRVALRPNATFSDGSPVDAQSVVDAFKRNFEAQPAAGLYLAKETVITAEDARTVQFKTPQPVGDFAVSLSAQHFVVHKPGADGASIMTGPYKPIRLQVDQQLEMAGFAGHWAGPPPLEKLTVKLLPDANARVLALQSGDVDFVYGIPAESAKALGSDIEVTIIPSARVHFMLLNHQKPPFSDVTVRRATSLALDRQALNEAALQGLGKPVIGPFPPGHGMDSPMSIARNLDQSRKLLDEASWKAGADGIRAKDGTRLAFTLYSQPGRAEITPMAILISGQLKDAGYDLQVQESRTLASILKDGAFEAAMGSNTTFGTGGPQRIFAHALLRGGVDNAGKYDSSQLQDTVNRMRAEVDLEKRKAIGREAQEIVLADMANIYLNAPPYIIGYRKDRVAGFTPHPNDLYFIDNKLAAR
jgi:peptide/nickel transport system substrate-binding protein